MHRHTFPKKIRLRRSTEFDAVFHGRHFAADDLLVMYAIKNELGWTRLGLSIGRKVGNAVVRNLWKRRIRESFRQLQHELPGGFDLVVRPRKGAVCDYSKIAPSLTGLTKRLAKKINRSQK